MNLLLRPLGTRAAHATPAGHQRAPLTQAVRVLLKTDDRAVLVDSIRQDANGLFTGEICSSEAEGGSLIQFREQHIFMYETAEDLEQRRASRLGNPAAVAQFEQSSMKPLTPEPSSSQIPNFHFEPLPEPSAERSVATIAAIESTAVPPRRRLQTPAFGAVCIAVVIGGVLGYALAYKPTPSVPIHEQLGEPAHLRLDYDLKNP